MEVPLPTESTSTIWWKRPLIRWTIAGVLIAFGAFCYLYSLRHPDIENQSQTIKPTAATTPTTANSASTKATPTAPKTTVESSGGFKLTSKSAFSCTAEAPADWTMSSNKESNSADLYGPGKKMYAGYGIQAVNEALAPYASAYSAPLNDPDLYSSDPLKVVTAYAKIVVASLGGDTNLEDVSSTKITVGDYQVNYFQSSTHKGAVFFHLTGIPGDGVNYSYAEPMYFAFTEKDLSATEGELVARIAASINCTSQLVHHDGPFVKARSSDAGVRPIDENGSAAGYDPQLGTEYVHDSSTGDNYLVDPSTNWSSDGPSGAGYYKTNGNDYTLLQPGRSD